VVSSDQVSPELLDFIGKLLAKDVLQRLDVHGAMVHPWVTLGGSAPLLSIKQQQMEHSSMANWAVACPGAGFGSLQVGAVLLWGSSCS
jgi:serine/threonine protein kinase